MSRDSVMRKHVSHFFLFSLFSALFCTGIFVWSTASMMRQGQEASHLVGEIYMNTVNSQMQLHFRSVIDLKLEQVESLIIDIPPESVEAYGPELVDRLDAGAKVRRFTYLALFDTKGAAEVVTGGEVKIRDQDAFLRALNAGEKNITSGVTASGEELLVIGLSVGYPHAQGYPMKDGRRCTALVAGLPFDYIGEALSMNTEKSMVFSQIIRKDGTFVLHGSAGEESHNRLLNEAFEQGDDGETFFTLRDDIVQGREHMMFVTVGGERLHMHGSPLPNSEWYLLTVMPHGSLDEIIANMWTRRVYMAVGMGLMLPLPILAMFFFYSRASRRQIAALEKAKSEADNASHAKSEFLSNMSHDIRTPMNAIVGMTAIASASPENTPLVQDCLHKINLASRHLLGLINDVLDMSKIEHGKLSLNISVVSLREIVEEVVGVAQPLVKAKKQQFDICIHDIIAENVYSDGVRLGQVMLNLLSNALKFTPQEGTVQVNLSQEPSPLGDEHVRTHIRVKDTGMGMSEEFQKKIYESFSREDNERIHRIEGSGLGMAIIKYIVDQMKGTIELQSAPGKGTEFHITLDMKKAGASSGPMVLPGWNALVVDDDENVCRSAAHFLTDMGVHAEWTTDGRTAVTMVEKHHAQGKDYHLVLLDWKMPGMSGMETARDLREHLGDDVPVLLISAYDWSDIEAEARVAGISGFIAKPLFKSTLFHGLRTFAESGGALEHAQEEKENFGQGRRLLVAEDNELNWEIASALLEQHGFTLDWAENGQICVDKFKASAPGWYDMVLMDVRMPVMDGYQAARALRALDRPDADIPIIAMTADAFSEDIRACLESGMNAHVAKPLDMKVLLRLIQKYLAGAS